MTFDEWWETLTSVEQMNAERGLLREAWEGSAILMKERCIKIIEAYQVPVGNSAAGELACEWTMQALKDIREAIKSLDK